VAQIVEYLYSKHEVLSSNPSTTKKRKKEPENRVPNKYKALSPNPVSPLPKQLALRLQTYNNVIGS
jgi:hypothetical protein